MRRSNFRHTCHLLLALICLIALFALAGCGNVIKNVRPPLAVPDSFSRAGHDPLPEKWWLSFEDAELNRLITQSLAGNFSLRMTRDRLKQARAVAGKSRAERFPDVSGEAALSRASSHLSGSGTETSSTYLLGLGAGYELDLWGRVRSNEKAARLDLLAAAEDLQAAAVTLSAEVATIWYRLIEQQRQIDLLHRQIATTEQYLDLVTRQFTSGQVPVTDVLQQRQALETSRANLINAETDRKLLEHQLALLTGNPPQSFTPPAAETLAPLPPLPGTGLPADLIRQRPDIRRSFYQVQAADQRVGAAIADRFPKISLAAGGETSAGNTGDLFNNWLASLTGNMVAPLFDGGRRRFEVERRKGEADEALHRYGQTVISAFKEVEDALWTESRLRTLLENIESRLALSELSTRQIRDRYIHGAVDFLRFLSAELSHQELERSHIRTQREVIEQRINLCRALAGGWQLEEAAADHDAPPHNPNP